MNEAIKKAMEDVKAAKKALKEAEQLAKEERKARCSTYQPVYQYKVHPQDYRRWYTNKKEETLPGFTVSRHWMNKDEYEELGGMYGSFERMREDKEVTTSVFYYRTDEGILTHTGGGYLMLKEPQLCSDEQWADCLLGEIPLKFFR